MERPDLPYPPAMTLQRESPRGWWVFAAAAAIFVGAAVTIAAYTTTGNVHNQTEIDAASAQANQDGYKAGQADGYRDGLAEGFDKGEAAGYSDGHAVGYRAGKRRGYRNGFNQGHEEGFTNGANLGSSLAFEGLCEDIGGYVTGESPDEICHYTTYGGFPSG